MRCLEQGTLWVRIGSVYDICAHTFAYAAHAVTLAMAGSDMAVRGSEDACATAVLPPVAGLLPSVCTAEEH